jgi:nucleotide-binding universal stress UspA family protein
MRVLIAYDGSTFADAAIEDLRKAGLPNETEALVVSVASGDLVLPDAACNLETDATGSWRSKFAEAEWLAETASKRIRACFPSWRVVPDEALWGDPAKVILQTASWWHPDLIVAGSHGRSRLARLFLGSVSMELVHKASCSVRVVRPAETPSNRGPIRIIVCTDGSQQAEAVMRAVARRSWPDKTEAKVIAVVQTLVPVATTALEASTYAQQPAYSVIQEADERLRFRLESVAAESVNALRRSGLVATSMVADGDPREVILAEAALLQSDTIFVGARGLGTMERVLLGSVSTHVVSRAHCTVEVVREFR